MVLLRSPVIGPSLCRIFRPCRSCTSSSSSTTADVSTTTTTTSSTYAVVALLREALLDVGVVLDRGVLLGLLLGLLLVLLLRARRVRVVGIVGRHSKGWMDGRTRGTDNESVETACR
jgi:hypothetical protein